MFGLLLAAIIPIGGDTISPDPTATNNTGGFTVTAARVAGEAPGPRAPVLVGVEAVLWGEGVETSTYTLDVFTKDDFLSVGVPSLAARLEKPELMPWGNAGLAGGYAPTFKARWSFDPIALDLDSYVFALRAEGPGRVRMSGSGAGKGLDDYYQRFLSVPSAKVHGNFAWNVLVEAPEAPSVVLAILGAFLILWGVSWH